MLGAALAMDAFSVSLAGGLHEPHMKRKRMCMIAGVFAGFQALMPMIGYVSARTVVTLFGAFEKAIPWIALILLCIIGGKMLFDGLHRKKDEEVPAVRFGVLMLQGIATSIDALSVGFTVFESYDVGKMLLGALIIACVTFVICIGGLLIGRQAGTAIGGRAEILGGIILIAIGIEIFIKG
ncbi:MAG: manganese efflux pump [Lachnospiraceae bacterium]|nr:manganese efflux pump [Lachnospiraceae bacterium]